MCDASKYANCINPSLIVEDGSKRVINVFLPPELHLLMGAVNVKLKLLIDIFGLEFVEAWLKQHGIIRHGYHGGGTDGNNSMKVLTNIDSLAKYLPTECAPVIDSLQALKKVVED